MTRALAIIAFVLAIVFALLPRARADNNPFSGATSISVEMTREPVEKRALQQKRIIAAKSQHPFRLHCTLDGRPINWKGLRISLDGESFTVPPDAAGPMMVLLWAGGARCGHRQTPRP